MTFGVGSIYNQANIPNSGGIPFPAGSAENGLSVDPITGAIVLGQDIGAIGDPGRFLSNREIPMAGFDFTMQSIGNRVLEINNGLFRYAFGDIDGMNNGWQLFLLDNNQFGEIGDVFGTGSGAVFHLDGNTGFARSQIFDNVNTYLDLDGNLNRYRVGDTQGGGNGSVLDINDTAQTSRMGDVAAVVNGSFLTVNDLLQSLLFESSNIDRLNLDAANGNYKLGFLNNVNFDRLEIDTPSQIARIELNGNQYLRLDLGSQQYLLGDINGISNGSRVFVNDVLSLITLEAGGNLNLSLNDAGGVYRIGDITGVGNGLMIQINDGGLKMSTRGTGELIGTLSGFLNNAAAAVGTLLNAPLAGNPTKWIPIDDNGTIRNIPAW